VFTPITSSSISPSSGFLHGTLNVRSSTLYKSQPSGGYLHIRTLCRFSQLIKNDPVRCREIFCSSLAALVLFCSESEMMRLANMQRKKIDLNKVLAALNTVCPSCGVSIPPAQVVRVDSERMRCPKCGHVFEAGNLKRGSLQE
jgi:predicted RNA-binding Zn-ribbon protein involved in translation (DUF1610 family)